MLHLPLPPTSATSFHSPSTPHTQPPHSLHSLTHSPRSARLSSLQPTAAFQHASCQLSHQCSIARPVLALSSQLCFPYRVECGHIDAALRLPNAGSLLSLAPSTVSAARCAMSSVPPPLPASPSGLLIGGSPAQLAMRAQAVLPAFPPLSPAVSASSLSPSSSPPFSSSPLADLAVTHVHLSSAQLPSSSPSLSARRDGPSSSLSVSGPPLPPAAFPASSCSSSLSYVAVDASLSVVSPAGAADSAGCRAHKAAICSLLEALQTTMFTKKKEALDAYQSYVASHHPRFHRSDALLLLYGSPVTPNSTLSSFQSTAAFTRIDKGLLAASGQLSWKNHQLRASATKALGLVALLLDSRHNADAAVFHQLISECDYPVIRLMKLPKHLSAPSPSSSAQGNLHAALRVIDIVKDIRPDLIDTLLEEKDAAAAQSSHSRPSASTAPRSSPPTLHISIQTNSAAGTPRSSQLHDAAPLSPRSPNSPPPLPSSLNDAYSASVAALHHSPPYRPPPPLPSTPQLQQPPPPPTLHFAPPPAISACQSPHSAAAPSMPWLSVAEAGSGPTNAAPSSITQPLSACSSPLATKKKQFGSLPAGLHRLQAASSSSSSSSSSSGSSGGFLSDDWKQRLRSHLSGFFAHRVSREELERAGVLKRSQLFGVALESLTAADDADHEASIPRLLRRCIDVLSAPDVLALHGLFRISGDSREINEMKVRLDVGEPVDLYAAAPHSVAGLLKMWLRELPEPLLTFDMYAPIIAAVRSQQQQQQQQPSAMLDALNALIEQLPAAHRATLEALLPFLRSVSSCSSVNLMTASNLAICFSPNILRPRIETLESVARDTPLAIAAITALIQQNNDEAHSSVQTPQHCVSPTSPTSPTSSRPMLPMPPPIPASPRSMSLPAAAATSAVSAVHHTHNASRSPPPIPSGVALTSLSRPPLPPPLPQLLSTPPPVPITVDKPQEECKCEEGQTELEQLSDV